MCTRNVAFAVWRQSRILIPHFVVVIVYVVIGGDCMLFFIVFYSKHSHHSQIAFRHNAESAVIVGLLAVYMNAQKILLSNVFRIECNCRLSICFHKWKNITRIFLSISMNCVQLLINRLIDIVHFRCMHVHDGSIDFCNKQKMKVSL